MIAILLGPLDAARGGQFIRINAQLATLLYGAAIAVLLAHSTLEAILIVWLFVVGESAGWGCPLGMALSGKDDGCLREWWQVGPLTTRPWLALCVRGVLWGAPLGTAGWLLDNHAALLMPAVMALAMVAAPALVRASIGWRPAKHLWPMQEWLRGWLVGVLILGVI